MCTGCTNESWDCSCVDKNKRHPQDSSTYIWSNWNSTCQMAIFWMAYASEGSSTWSISKSGVTSCFRCQPVQTSHYGGIIGGGIGGGISFGTPVSLAVPTETKTHAMRMPIVTIMLDLVVNKDCLTYEKAIDAIKPCLWQHCSGSEKSKLVCIPFFVGRI
jgi:hypothetical protein